MTTLDTYTGEVLRGFTTVASTDPAQTLLGLQCQRCSTVLCHVEPDDDLGVLATVATVHASHDCTQPTWTVSIGQRTDGRPTVGYAVFAATRRHAIMVATAEHAKIYGQRLQGPYRVNFARQGQPDGPRCPTLVHDLRQRGAWELAAYEGRSMLTLAARAALASVHGTHYHAEVPLVLVSPNGRHQRITVAEPDLVPPLMTMLTTHGWAVRTPARQRRASLSRAAAQAWMHRPPAYGNRTWAAETAEWESDHYGHALLFERLLREAITDGILRLPAIAASVSLQSTADDDGADGGFHVLVEIHRGPTLSSEHIYEGLAEGEGTAFALDGLAAICRHVNALCDQFVHSALSWLAGELRG